jgi:RNA polymerase sigma-70 factor (ECF subfamily)
MAVTASRTGPTDPELLSRIAQGDLASLGELYDRYAVDVRRFVGRVGARAVQACEVDDLVQSTFLLVIGAGHGYDGRVAARPWLLGLAANVVRQHRRSVTRLARKVAAWAAEPKPHGGPSPADVLAAKEAGARAQRAIESLPWKKRVVFLMVVVEGVSGEQAAVALGIPLATVWTRLHHARRDIRRLLAEGERQ